MNINYMKYNFLRFPQGKEKAITLSYDDGVVEDERLVEIMRSNGVKGTFNINTGLYGANWDWVGPAIGDPTIPHQRFTEEELKAAEKEYGGKPEKKHQKGNVDIDANKNNSKSLFHQDDEDYVPPVKDEEEKPEIKTDDSGAISKAPLKDDKKHDTNDK